jgi:hypothetical protein
MNILKQTEIELEAYKKNKYSSPEIIAWLEGAVAQLKSGSDLTEEQIEADYAELIKFAKEHKVQLGFKVKVEKDFIGHGNVEYKAGDIMTTGLTRNQSLFALFLLKHQKQISKIGEFTSVFELVRDFTKSKTK